MSVQVNITMFSFTLILQNIFYAHDALLQIFKEQKSMLEQKSMSKSMSPLPNPLMITRANQPRKKIVRISLFHDHEIYNKK